MSLTYKQPGRLIQVTKALYASSSSSSMDMQGMGRACRVSSTRVVVVQKTERNEVEMSFYRPVAQASRLQHWALPHQCGLSGIGDTTTVSPIKSRQTRKGFPAA